MTGVDALGMRYVADPAEGHHGGEKEEAKVDASAEMLSGAPGEVTMPSSNQVAAHLAKMIARPYRVSFDLDNRLDRSAKREILAKRRGMPVIMFRPRMLFRKCRIRAPASASTRFRACPESEARETGAMRTRGGIRSLRRGATSEDPGDHGRCSGLIPARAGASARWTRSSDIAGGGRRRGSSASLNR